MIKIDNYVEMKTRFGIVAERERDKDGKLWEETKARFETVIERE